MTPSPPSSRLDLRMPALLVGVVLSTVDASALNIALPTLANHFGVGAGAVQGVASLYLFGSALAFIPLAHLAGRVGTIRVYRFSLLAFSLLSLLLALAPDFPTLLALRFLQGVAGAGIVGLTAGLASATFPDRRGWALSMISGSAAAGLVLGPPVGGFIVELLGWRYVFLINLPLGFFALLLSGRLGDLRGVGLFEGLRRAVAAPRFLLALSATVLFFAQAFGLTLIWPFYLEAQGVTPLRVGLLLLIPPLLALVIAPFAGNWADRKGFDKMSRLGALVLALASWVQGVAGSVWPGLLGSGLGRALAQGANNAAVMSLAPEGTETLASGLLSEARVVGQTLGGILAGSLWGALAPYGVAFDFLVVNLVLGLVVVAAGALVVRRTGR